MENLSNQIFINLPVSDLDRSIQFFKTLGFSFNPQFTDENATCMLISDQIYVMLLVEKFFKGFTKKEIVDSQSATEVILSLSATSRAAVDEFADTALKAGATFSNEPQDMGFMYNRSFQDLDGHLWEVFYMDPQHLEA